MCFSLNTNLLGGYQCYIATLYNAVKYAESRAFAIFAYSTVCVPVATKLLLISEPNVIVRHVGMDSNV